MSLETALAENTAAINNLIAVWSKLNAQADSLDKAPADTVIKAAGKSVKAAPAAAKAETKEPAASTAPAATAAPTASSTISPEEAYIPVGKAITTFAAANGRDATLAVLSTFGVTSGKALKPEQYEAVLAAFAAAPAEESVA